MRLTTFVLVILVLFAPEIGQRAYSARTAAEVASRKGSLSRKLTDVKRKMNTVRTKLHQTRIERKNVMGQLQATQRKLDDSQEKVSRNTSELSSAQDRLKVISKQLKRKQADLDRRSKLLSKRIVGMYEGEDIGYVDVMLGSRDMRTFLSRGYYVRQIVKSDVNLIGEFKKAKAEIEADKKRQATEVRRIASLQSSLVEQRDEVADLAADKAAELDAIEHNVALYEHALAQLRADSQRIEDRIQSLQATPGGQKRLAKKFSGGLSMPVSGRISCRFGYRHHPITHVYSMHTGVDIACPSGTPIHAAADGEVILAGWYGAYGNAVVIDHGGGVSTLYGHNSRLLVSVGQQVRKGEVIARAGSTGWSTGPHCHFEKRVNGRPVNPM